MRIPTIPNLLLYASLLALTACGGGGGTSMASLSPTGGSATTSTTGSGTTTTGSSGTTTNGGSTDPSSGAGGSSGSTTSGTSGATTGSSGSSGSTTGSTGSAGTSSSGTTGSGSSGTTGSTTTNPPVVTFDWPNGAGSGGVPLPVASASTPGFSTVNPIGVTFPLAQAMIAITQTRVASDIEPSSITQTGTETVNGQVLGLFELKVPSLGLDVPNLPTDGTSVTLADGSKVSMSVGGLDYSLFSFWSVAPASNSGTARYAAGTTGYLTPNASVPASGTATYAGNGGSTGGVVGEVLFAPSTGGVAAGTVHGQANLSVNFSNATISGALTNMTITPAGGGAAAQWNTINLSGSISGSSVSGNATSSSPTPSVPTTGYIFNVSYGHFDGAFYGPNGQEIGGVWTLIDSTTPNKAAFGVFGATKQ